MSDPTMDAYRQWRLTHPPIMGGAPDEDEEAVEVDSAAQSAVDDQAPVTDTPPPWGEEFDAQRAWNTITHQRGLLKELESKAKELDRLESDEEARLARLREWGYEVPEDDPDEEPDPYTADLSELKQWKQEQEARQERELRQREWAGFSNYLNELAEAAGFELSEREHRFLGMECVDEDGFPLDQKQAKKAFEAHAKWREEQRQAALTDLKGSKKRASRPPSEGATATQVPELNSHAERMAYAKQQLAAYESQQ